MLRLNTIHEVLNMSKTPPKIDITKHPEFRVVHVNNFLGTLNTNEGTIKFYLDIIEPRIKTGGKPGEMEVDRITREFQVEVRMSPRAFMALADWATACVNELEKKGVLKREKKPKKEGQTYRV